MLALALIEKAHELLDAVEADAKGAARTGELIARLLALFGAGAKSPDDWIATKVVAKTLGLRNENPILDAGRRGQLRIRGPRGARLVRRGELDAWIESRGLEAKKPAVVTAKSPLREPTFEKAWQPGKQLPEPVAERMRALVTKHGLKAIAREHMLTVAAMGELLGIAEAPPQPLRVVR